MEHKHTWVKSKRMHGNLHRFFVECSDPDCRLEMQATLRHGHIHVFHTGIFKGGKSKVTSYRLHEWQRKILKQKGMTFVEFVDKAFQSA